MRSLVVYDSSYGNTEQIARAIADGLQPSAGIKHVGSVGSADLEGVDLLIVGSPTQGGRPTPAVTKLLDGMPAMALRDTHVAAFDTRIDARTSGIALRLLLRVIGFAAPRIARRLQDSGGLLAVAPEGFVVEGKEGPLRSGEVERAKAWARALAANQASKTPEAPRAAQPR